MGENNTTLSDDDKEQLEYIRQWYEMKEQEKQRKIQRRCIRKLHWNFAKGYFKAAIEELILWLKCYMGKDV